MRTPRRPIKPEANNHITAGADTTLGSGSANNSILKSSSNIDAGLPGNSFSSNGAYVRPKNSGLSTLIEANKDSRKSGSPSLTRIVSSILLSSQTYKSHRMNEYSF